MWKLHNIQASNFMSFENLSFDFDSKCYVVRANNLDNEGQQSNGGGKTSFVDAIAVALLGKSLTGRNVKDCVRWGAKESFFTIRCELVNKAHDLTCVIERKVFNNTRSQHLALLINDQVPSSLPTKRGVENGVDIKAGNAYILEQVLCIPESDLLSYYLISKDKYQPFLNINTASKLDVIGRFSKAQVVDKAIDNLHTSVDVRQKSIDDIDRQIATQQGYLEALHNSIDAKEFEQIKQQQIYQYEEQLNAIEILLVDKEEEIDKEQEAQKEYSGCYSDVDSDHKNKLKEELGQINESEFVELLNQTRAEIGIVQNYLAGVIECPKCHHEFTFVDEGESYTQEDLSTRQEVVEELEKEIEAIRLSRSFIRTQIEDIEKVEKENRDIDLEIERVGRKIKSIQDEQARLMKDFDRIQGELDKVRSKTFESQKSTIQNDIKQKEQEIVELQSQLEQLRLELDETKGWITNFEDFKFYLGNKPIEAICSLVNQYLQLNGSDLNLHIEGFKKLRSGELRQSLEPVIYRNWTNPQTFDQFSQGEKVRLNLAVDLAFQYLLNQSNELGGLDLYINDELLNPLDSIGVANAAKAFNQLQKTIMLVTHSGADMVYDNTILIEKQNGTSKVGESK